MWIVMTILKWIGIVLGGILGLLLFFGVLILFVPVRYGVVGCHKEEFVYSFKVTWLFPLVWVGKKMNSQRVVLKFFGIPIKCLSGKDSKRKSKKDGKTGDDKEENGEEKETVTKKTEEKKKSKKKKGFSFSRVSSIIDLVRDTDNRNTARRIFGELRMLLQYLAPQKVKGRMVIGTGDPCTTGLLFAGISIFPAAYLNGVEISPDFEEKRFEGEGSIKGRLRVIYLIRLVLRLYQDRELKRLWKQINNKGKKEAA